MNTQLAQLSPRDKNTYKHWLTAVAAVYFTLVAAVVLGVTWDLSHRDVSPLQTAGNVENQTAIAAHTYDR